MKIHQPDIAAINEFFSHGITLLKELEKGTSQNAEYNVRTFRPALAEAWMRTAERICGVLLLEDTDPE